MIALVTPTGNRPRQIELCAEWKDKHHRIDGPATIGYYSNGEIQMEFYYKKGTYHRENGPAYLSYDFDGSIQIESYYKNGVYHREDGPADIFYSHGTCIKERYYLNGEQLTDPLKTSIMKGLSQ
jgi:antitoxin component YwqK of YwqJK toxin-antitoxin module